MSENQNQAPEEKSKDNQQNDKPLYSPTLLKDMASFKEQKIYLITDSFEDKIPEILSYLLEKNSINPIKDKIQLLQYLDELFKNIEYNSEIFSCKTSNGVEKLNIFEVIIHEYVINTKSNLDSPNEEQIQELEKYKEELKNIFSILLSSISLDKKTYHYIFSFLINFINQKNNHINTNEKLNSEQISGILELLHLYYQRVQNVDDASNYLYFNNIIKEENKQEYLINVTNKDNLNRKKILSLDDSLNILLFIKLMPNEVVKKVDANHNCGLFELVFADQSKSISFNIDNENNLINNVTKDKIVKLEENKDINILFRINLKDSLKIEIFRDNKKIDFQNDQIAIQENEKAKIREKYEIKAINFFKNFIGECSNIIIFKNKKVEGYPKFFLCLKAIEEKKPMANTISALFEKANKEKTENKVVKTELAFNPIFEKGIHNEAFFNILLKQELKEDVEQNIIDNIISNKKYDKIHLADIKEFTEKILAIYIPSRFEVPNELGSKNVKKCEKIILKDSINNLDAIFNKIKSNEEGNKKISNLNGIHLFNRIIDDFDNIGGLNHLIPIIELMNNSPVELLTTDNIYSFFSLITLILSPYYKNGLKNEKNSNFFFNLSYFLEKIPNSFYNNELASSLISLSQLLLSFMSQDAFIELNKQYHSYILFNQKILFKFKHTEQKSILGQIKTVLTMISNSNNDDDLNIDIKKIINILLYYDKEQYSKFCCKKHSEYFNTKCEIMNPELSEVIKPLEDILKLYFKKYNNEAQVTKDSKESKNANVELTKNGIYLINLFEVLTMGTSPCIQKSIIALFSQFFKDNLNQANKYINLIEKEGKIFDICLFVFKNSIFDVKNDILNVIYLLVKIKNNLNLNVTTNKSKDKEKEILPSVSLSGIKEIFLSNNLLPYYLLPKEELTNIKEEKIKKQFYINGEEYNYLTKTDLENKIYSNYNQSKIKDLIDELYSTIYKTFIEDGAITNLKFLLKILSKSDLSLIITFLQNISKEKNKLEEIYDNQELLHWLLETNFQAFLIKSTNYDKNKIISRFNLNEEEKDLKTKIETIIKLCNELLINIFKKNIYKIDYLLTWAKYYNEISLSNKKMTNELVLEYIINILIDIDKNKLQKEIIICDKNDTVNNNIQKEGLYFMNIIFEFITYFKFTPIKKDESENIKLNEENNIYDELFSTFNTILIKDVKNNNFSESLKAKWKYYSFLKKLFSYFVPLWNKILKEENDIFGKYIENKKNINTYITETEILFCSLDDINELNSESSKKNTINRGIQVIYILYHYFTNLFNLGGDKEEIKEILTEFRLFLTFVIVGSSTLSTNIDKKKRKWPKSEDYQMVQLTVKNILYHAFHFFYTNIKKFDEILESNKNLSETEKNYNLYIKNILYETFGQILKVLNRIFRQIRKEEDKKHNKKGMKGLFSKMKGIFSDSEGAKASGGYFLMEKLYSDINLNTNFDVKNYLDNIPHIDFKSKDVKNVTVNPKLEECIKSFIKEGKLKTFFEAISVPSKDEEELNKNKLYPFIEYIKKRSLQLNWLIPFYDNIQNIDYENDEKNYIFKKLLLVADYFPKCEYEDQLSKNIKDINKNINKVILLNLKKNDIEEKTKIFEYIKDKKKLFSFLSIWSNKDFFYNKDKYELKYKLVNHLTNDYTRVLLKPILNIDYYLPEFTQFNYDILFRKQENKNELYCLTDLSFLVKEHKTPLITESEDNQTEEEEKKESEKQVNEEKTEENKDNFNSLYDIKLNSYKDLENFTKDKEIIKNDLSNELFVEYIKQKYLVNATQHDTEVDSCLIKLDSHITGIFFNNSKGIGFYSYNKIHKEGEEDYDIDRKACFGSIFRPQNNKYNYYYINIPYNSIEFVLRRKYYYKRTALEIFTVNKKSYLFRIEDNKIKTIIDNIKYYMKSTIEDIYIEYSKYEDKIGFYNKRIFLNLNNGFIPLTSKKREMDLKDIYEKWTKWKISTMKMLMIINLYGNRSFNDLNQYPVVPWIITDYSSKDFPSLLNLDPKLENTLIRPFGTPMGMMELTEDSISRKNNYIEHWKSSDEDKEKEDNYDRYRSHYSTSLYTTYYLVRLFPYSSLRIELQGKNFDDPNRLFNSLPVSFTNAISQKADLRELIPEFFYLPEFFYNFNKLNLGEVGEVDNKVPVGDIALPPWSKASGYLFINKHRELLESPEISEKINEWINIIFGSKQKGKDAKKIYNLFMKESYEDFDEEYKKSEFDHKIYLCKLVEFGITPNQVFKSDANKRNAYIELKNKRQLLPNTTEYLKRQLSIVDSPDNNEIDIAKELIVEETGFHIFGIPYKLAYCELGKEKCRIFAVTHDKIKVFKRICEKIQVKKSVPVEGLNTAAPQSNKDSNNSIDSKEQGDNKDEEKDIIKINLEQKKEIKLSCPRYKMNDTQAPIVFYNDGKNVALGGFYNGNILVQNVDENIDDKKAKVKCSTVHLTNEISPIVQMVISKSDIFVICGNTFGTIYIFIINESNKSEWTLYKTIHDHQSEITSISINENLNIFISCSRDGYCNLYTLPNCHLVNSFKITDRSFQKDPSDNNSIYYPNITIISNSPLPCIIFYIENRQSLSVFSINGHFIKEEKLDFKISANGIKKYTDMQFKDYLLIFNPNKSCIDVYNIIDLKSVLSLPTFGHGFVDFIMSRDLDHLLVLVKFKGKNEEKLNEQVSAKTTFKILVIRNPNCDIEWK